MTAESDMTECLTRAHTALLDSESLLTYNLVSINYLQLFFV